MHKISHKITHKITYKISLKISHKITYKISLKISHKITELEKNQKQLLHTLIEIRRHLQLIIQKLDVAGTSTDAAGCGLDLEPYTRDEDFMDFDARIADEEEKKKLILALSRIGGKNAKETTKFILRRVMSNKVQALYNREGVNRKEKKASADRVRKKAFKETNFYKVVIDTALLVNKDATEKEIVDVIGKELCTDPDRLGGGGRGGRRTNRGLIFTF
ncbi:uncharacterized protein [Clytia hemisphaerica]|uniref:uncharacterized protein n=1 Tax=Clytia hemisphaerica TaxID=252671 RepID=UPI0034D5D0BD